MVFGAIIESSRQWQVWYCAMAMRWQGVVNASLAMPGVCCCHENVRFPARQSVAARSGCRPECHQSPTLCDVPCSQPIHGLSHEPLRSQFAAPMLDGVAVSFLVRRVGGKKRRRHTRATGAADYEEERMAVGIGRSGWVGAPVRRWG